MVNDTLGPVDSPLDLTIEKAEHHAHHAGFSGALTDKELDDQARCATAIELAMPLWQGIKTYRMAVFWSIVVSSTIIMQVYPPNWLIFTLRRQDLEVQAREGAKNFACREGYDTTLIGSFYAYPAFKQKYGEWFGAEKGWQLTAPWQAGISDIQAVGNIIGALANGYFTQKYGHRPVMMVSLLLMTGFVFVTFFAPNVETLLVGAFLCSIPWGTFATMGPAYAAEVCPLVLRGYLSVFVNLCWAIGQLLSAAILKALVNNKTQWSYRIPFAIQWIWPVPLMIAAYFCPESPWHLVRVNKLDKAENSLKRLSQKGDNVDHEATIALMVHTTRLEEEEELGTTYWDCFKGTNLRRTEIACGAFLSQITNGGAFAYSPTYFFEQAGIAPDDSYSIGLGGTVLAFMGTLFSWFVMSRIGRRPIFLAGFCCMIFCLLTIGILACVPQSTGIKYVQASLCLVWLGSYSMTVGPIVYTIVAEIGATRLRTKTVVLGRSTYYVGNIVGGVLEPYMINPSEWNWRGKTAFFWGTLSVITTAWAWFRLPETIDRTFEELDVLFLRRVPARKFSKANLERDNERIAAGVSDFNVAR